MATKIYSEWNHSRFSCWWNINLEHQKEQQLLHIRVYPDEGEGRTYQEIMTQSSARCAQDVVNLGSSMPRTFPTPDQQCNELAAYMDEFVRDVDSAYTSA